jgi:hypothetical protein
VTPTEQPRQACDIWVGEELSHQTRLADPRLPLHDHHGRPYGDGRRHSGKLDVAANKNRRHERPWRSIEHDGTRISGWANLKIVRHEDLGI